MLKIIATTLLVGLGLGFAQDSTGHEEPVAPSLDQVADSTPQDCGSTTSHMTAFPTSNSGAGETKALARRAAKKNLKTTLGVLSGVQCATCPETSGVCDEKVAFDDPSAVQFVITGQGPFVALASYFGGYTVECVSCN